jgi:hypothetical protein
LSLRLPLTKESPLVRPSPALPTDAALRAIAEDLIAEVKYATAVAAAERRSAPGALYGAVHDFISTRTPAAQQRAQVKARALLGSSDAHRQLVFGRFSAVKPSDYLTRGSDDILNHLTDLRIDPAVLRGGLDKFRNFHLIVPKAPKTDPDLQAGLAFKKLRVFLAAVRCVEETDELSDSDEINIGGVRTDPFGHTKVIDEFVVSDDFDEGEVVNYAGLGHKLTGWELVTNQGWPISYVITLAMAEKDDGGFWAFLQKLWEKIKEKAEALIGAGIGAAVGGALGGVLGAIVGAVVGALIGWIISLFDNEDDIIGAIPVTLSLGAATKSYYDWAKLTSSEGLKTTLHFKGDGGYYRARLRYKVFTD